MKNEHPELINQEPHKTVMAGLEESFKIGKFTYPDLEYTQPEAEALLFKGTSIKKFQEYVRNYTNKKSPCFNNLKLKDLFFLPMIEIINYLHLNDFKVYVISGTGRYFIREIIKNHVVIPDERIIGTDMNLIKSQIKENEKKIADEKLPFSKNDEMVFGGKIIKKMIQLTKVRYIICEVGKKPVLSFANSNSDVQLCNYVLGDNKYKAQVYMVVADDIERDYGIDIKNEDGTIDTSKSDAIKQKWVSDNYNIISMRDDFDTIYGKNVTKREWINDFYK